MFVEQNPHIDYRALEAAIEAELKRPPSSPPAPAPLLTPVVETTPAAAGAAAQTANRMARRLQRWPLLYRLARRGWRGLRAAVAGIRKRPAVHYCVRWVRWWVSLPRLADLVAAQAVQLDQQRATLLRLETQQHLQQQALQAETGSLEHRHGKVLRAHAATMQQLASQHHLLRETIDALNNDWHVVRRMAVQTAPAHATEASGPAPTAQPISAVMDRFYQDFEDAWRGPQAEIRQRVAHYLPRVLDAQAGQPDAPLVDIGSGRGEWLWVLNEAGLAAFGVDSNASAVERTRAQGLTAFEADAGPWLAARPAASLGAVTALHVVEHLPFEALVHLLDHALRALRPGGLLILETPDPANMMVATHSFWLDPSHMRPIPADLLAFTVRSRGFEAVEIERLHPVDRALWFPSGDAVAERLNTLLYGPQDYAVIARKPLQ